MTGSKDDERLLRRIEQRLAQHGLRAPCNIIVRVSKGVATLGGTIQYEYQRRIAVHTVRSVDGVGDVVDEMRVGAKTRAWD